MSNNLMKSFSLFFLILVSIAGGMFSNAVNCMSPTSVSTEKPFDSKEPGSQRFGVQPGRLEDDKTEGIQLCFTGNAIQRQLFKEVIEILNRSGTTFTHYKNDARVLAYLDATAHTCTAALDAIRESAISQAMAWTNLAHICERATAVVASVASQEKAGEGFANEHGCPQQFVRACKGTLELLLDSNQEGKSLAEIQNAYKDFSRFSFDMQTQYAAGMLLKFAVPLKAKKYKVFFSYYKALERLHQVGKIEASVLQRLSDEDLGTSKIIQGVAVPSRFSRVIEQFVVAGKITTREEITQWLEFLQAPFGFGIANAVLEIMA